jgi:hypothetical protein
MVKHAKFLGIKHLRGTEMVKPQRHHGEEGTTVSLPTSGG